MSDEVVQLFRNGSFDLAGIQALSDAYELARKSLRDTGQPPIVNEVLARRIVDQAESGERNPRALATAALKTFGLQYL